MTREAFERIVALAHSELERKSSYDDSDFSADPAIQALGTDAVRVRAALASYERDLALQAVSCPEVPAARTPVSQEGGKTPHADDLHGGVWDVSGPGFWDEFPEGFHDAFRAANELFNAYMADCRANPNGSSVPGVKCVMAQRHLCAVIRRSSLPSPSSQSVPNSEEISALAKAAWDKKDFAAMLELVLRASNWQAISQQTTVTSETIAEAFASGAHWMQERFPQGPFYMPSARKAATEYAASKSLPKGG